MGLEEVLDVVLGHKVHAKNYCSKHQNRHIIKSMYVKARGDGYNIFIIYADIETKEAR